MKKHFLKLLLMILIPHYTYAFFNLDFPSLDGFKSLSTFNIRLFESKDTPEYEPHKNVDMQDMEIRYPWLKDTMSKILTNKENNSSYYEGLAYFQKLDDLNNDTISEIYLSTFNRCNSGVCKYDVYELVPKIKKLRLIFDSYNTKMLTSNSKQSKWKTLQHEVEHNMTKTVHTYDYNGKNGFYEKTDK